jgi:hypothetical protein
MIAFYDKLGVFNFNFFFCYLGLSDIDVPFFMVVRNALELFCIKKEVRNATEAHT